MKTSPWADCFNKIVFLPEDLFWDTGVTLPEDAKFSCECFEIQINPISTFSAWLNRSFSKLLRFY